MRNVCQPCGEDGKIVEAIRICVQCEESYCEVCSQFHSAQKLTRSHELQKLDQAQGTEVCDSQEKTDDEKSNSEHGGEEFVEERDGSCREKTIILMGETGSGKSTLVNSLANYLLQVEYQDDVRFELVYLEKEEHSKNQAQSITEWISAYIIHPSCGSRLDYTLNIVDMPGFGDTRGIDFDERTVSQLRHLFTSKSADGLSHIDAVCFLLRAPDARLTTTQNYIFDSILSVFGKNIADNIFLMITFADTNTPEVLAAISKKEGLKSKPHFLFNNCSLYSGNDDVDDSPYYFWKKTVESFDAFFEKLGRVETKSLKLSAEVLRAEGYH
ncbi:hypothetical protein FSP39_011549 [Pinctada imbricata]|uniref:AIG1-type G domain-containing protein n=1 Tax=Pinctada imbricata TaxID=66713 RepID=A0AA89BJ81_PINIB|nr:hypothetical protein FSP39_011549 [Pinctada imbricata]